MFADHAWYKGESRQSVPCLGLEVPIVCLATGTRSAFAHAPIKGHIHLSHPKGADHLGNAKAIPPHHFMVGMIWNRHDETQAVIAIRRRWRMRRNEGAYRPQTLGDRRPARTAVSQP